MPPDPREEIALLRELLECKIQELGESENHFRNIIGRSADGVVIVDAEGIVRFVNPAAEALLGRGRGELLGTRFAHPFRQGAPAELEIAREDGARAVAEMRVTATEWENRPACLLSLRDMTERVRMEEALRESEERYRQLFENGNDAVFVHAVGEDGSMGTFIEVNDVACRRLGYGREELLRMSPRDVDDPEAFRDLGHVVEVLRAGGQVVFETIHVSRDGRRIPVEVNARSFSLGGVRTVLAIARDITDRKAAEAELARLWMAVEQVREIIILTDVEGVVQYVNPAFERISGCRKEHFLGRNIRALGTDTVPENRYEEAMEAVSRGEVWSGILTRRNGDGGSCELDAVVSPVCDASGKLVNFVAVERDVTQVRRMEAQLRQSQKMEAVGRLAGGIAHDFNNLLTAITGYSDLLLTRIRPSEPHHREIGEIRKAGDRAASLVRQLLAYSRKQMMHPERMDLGGVVEGMEPMLRRMIREDIELVVRRDGAAAFVTADLGQIEQVILNLAVNARDAMPRGGRLTIETAAEELSPDAARGFEGLSAGPCVRLTVADTGIGMDRDTKSHLFEPFFTTKEQGQGTGLGLATVYGIVKQSGGDIRVESEPGKGTCVHVFLPSVPAPEGTRPAVEGAEPEPARGTETILLVEDEDVVRELVREVLSDNGYSVLEARDGGEALALAGRHRDAIHLMLTDVVMPQMSGRELAERAASLLPGLKVLYMSGYTEDAVIRHGVMAAGAPFLQKPFAPNALVRKVRDVLEERRAPA